MKLICCEISVYIFSHENSSDINLFCHERRRVHGISHHGFPFPRLVGPGSISKSSFAWRGKPPLSHADRRKRPETHRPPNRRRGAVNRWPQTRLGSAILRLPATPTPTRRRHAGTRPAPYTLVCVAPPRSYVPPLSTSYYGNDLKLSPRSEEECRIRQGPRSDARLFQGSPTVPPAPTSSFDLGGKYLTR